GVGRFRSRVGAVTDLHSGTCTGADGTYTRTKATYTGNATSSDARLNGTLTVRAKTFYNADTNLGVVEGHFRVENADGHTNGKFVAVDTNGTLDGWLGGRHTVRAPACSAAS